MFPTVFFFFNASHRFFFLLWICFLCFYFVFLSFFTLVRVVCVVSCLMYDVSCVVCDVRCTMYGVRCTACGVSRVLSSIVSFWVVCTIPLVVGWVVPCVVCCIMCRIVCRERCTHPGKWERHSIPLKTRDGMGQICWNHCSFWMHSIKLYIFVQKIWFQ